MRVFIAGMDGYLGWSLTLHLVARGHEVSGCDAFLRRKWVEERGSWSAIAISSMQERIEAVEERFGVRAQFRQGDLQEYDFVKQVFQEFQPEAIVHLGECPSAPYSMMDAHHATWVQTNNVVGTLNILYAIKEVCPRAHLVKLGTMGEYGTPNLDIPEGFFTIDYKDRSDTLPFPRQAGSWYHWSKVHDSNNIMLSCRLWGLRSTDIMQGVVFGTRIDQMGEDPRLLTRLDFDECFGTVINRFCCQAVIGHPLTPFGKGHQRRGFINLGDSMQCMTIAVENPPEAGEYRVFNQFENVYGIAELAEKVKVAGQKVGLDVQIHSIENPRTEAEEHYYNPDRQHLIQLGYQPSRDIDSGIAIMLQDLMKYRVRIEEKKRVLIPDIHWDGRRQKVRYMEALHRRHPPEE